MSPSVSSAICKEGSLLVILKCSIGSTSLSSGSSGLGKLFGSTTFVGLLARAKPSSSLSQQYQQPPCYEQKQHLQHVAAAAAFLPSFSYSNHPHSLPISGSIGSIFLGSISVAALLSSSSAARPLLFRLQANSRSSDSAVLAVKWLIT